MSSRQRWWAFLGAVVVVLAIFGWRKHDENRRELRALAEHVYSLAGYGDELPRGGSYRRDVYGDIMCKDVPDWVGKYGVGVGGTRERASGAEPIASALEQEGWIVERLTFDLSPTVRGRQIFARRGSTSMEILFGTNNIRIGVFDGPCGDYLSFSEIPDYDNPVKVATFED